MTFLIIGSIGLLLLTLSFVFDGVLDIFDFDFLDNGFISGISISAFVAVFGFTGWLTYNLGFSTFSSVLTAVIAGVLAGSLIGWIAHFLKQGDQADGTYSVEKLLGKTGLITSGANAGKYGTISIQLQGSTENFGALSEYPLKRGDTVKVVQVLSPSSVKVELL